MTPSEAETIAAMDNATVAILNALITFLEMKGAVKREDFREFLQATIKSWYAEGADPKLMRLVKLKAEAMELGPLPSENN